MNANHRSLNLVMGSGSLYAASSGPYLAVKDLAYTMGQLVHAVALVGTRDHWSDPQPMGYGLARTFAFRQVGPYSLHYAPGQGRWLDRGEVPADVVSLCGLWLHSNHRLARWATKNRMPYLITPSGKIHRFTEKPARAVRLGIESWHAR